MNKKVIERQLYYAESNIRRIKEDYNTLYRAYSDYEIKDIKVYSEDV